MHQNESAVQVASQQGAGVFAANSVDGHVVVAGVVTRVNFKGQFAFYCQFDPACPTPIAQ